MKLVTKRFYVTDIQLLKQVKYNYTNRISYYEPRAEELIYLIRKKDYGKAKILVKMQSVNVDGHTRYENTPLTDASKRGDFMSTKFLLEELNANPNASCDCPCNKTALHYASENNDKPIIELLLKNKANPELTDSHGRKPINLTKDKACQALLQIKNNLLLK